MKKLITLLVMCCSLGTAYAEESNLKYTMNGTYTMFYNNTSQPVTITRDEFSFWDNFGWGDYAIANQTYVIKPHEFIKQVVGSTNNYTVGYLKLKISLPGHNSSFIEYQVDTSLNTGVCFFRGDEYNSFDMYNGNKMWKDWEELHVIINDNGIGLIPFNSNYKQAPKDVEQRDVIGEHISPVDKPIVKFIPWQ